jgi:hypothetical protein
LFARLKRKLRQIERDRVVPLKVTLTVVENQLSTYSLKDTRYDRHG